jgi:putative ABC transport system substrate-binding protein
MSASSSLRPTRPCSGLDRIASVAALVLPIVATMVLPASADERTTRVFHLGIVAGTPRSNPERVAFEDRLRELGYGEGRNLTIDFVQDDDFSRLAVAIGEMARRRIDLILIGGQDLLFKAAVTAARSTPVVTTAVDADPVARGYVASLAHPGGNLTGVAFVQSELIVKRLELLRELAPHMSRVVLLYDAYGFDQAEAVKSAATTLAIPVAAFELSGPPYDYERVLAATDGTHGDVLLVASSPVMRSKVIAQIALQHRLPSICGNPENAKAGCLLSYGPDYAAMFRLAADYVDKILKGAKPADLPMQQPTRFEFVVNLKTADTLGITLPQSLLARADEVIE